MTHTLKRLGVKSVVALGLGLGAWTSGEGQPSLTWLDQQDRESRAYGVSNNGVVVGYYTTSYYDSCCYQDWEGNCNGCWRTYYNAFRWTSSGGMQYLGTLGGSSGIAHGVSADGQVVVGGAEFDYLRDWYMHPFRWTPSNGMQRLVTDEELAGRAYAVSANGSVVVGGLNGTAFRWTMSSGIQYLERLPNYNNHGHYAQSVSADGTVVVGYVDMPYSKRAFRWMMGSGIQDLGTLGGNSAAAYDVSDDGSVIVGWASNASRSDRAFRWHNGIMQDLGVLPNQGWSAAYSVSADGSIVVGRSGNRAFRWTASGGMEDLNVVYANLLPQGWRLATAYAISPDGRYIVGWAESTTTWYTKAFLLDTGPRCTAHNGDVDGSGCVDDADLLAVLFAFGNQGQDGVDVNCDGTVDDADLLQVLFNFGSGC